MKSKKKGCLSVALRGLMVIAGLCLLLIILILIINSRQPTQSTKIDRLSPADKARLAEVIHLRQALGDQVMPGWSQAVIPVIAYNEQYLFLVGCTDPESGWRKVPQNTQLGQDWEVVPGDDFYGQIYYRQPLPAPGVTTENFTVRVGEHWVASLMSLEWMKICLASELRSDIPQPFSSIVPYPIVVRLFVPGSESYVTGVLHEAMHAYQGQRAPARLAAAEQSSRKTSAAYPWEEAALTEAWQKELDLLHQAMRATTQEESLQLAREFLHQREMRREAAKLSDALIDYERCREWEEGIAKYAERMIYLLAHQTPAYQPLPEMDQDPEFQQYQGAQKKWDQEVDQIRRMANDPGDGRFYYSGFAQAVLLDRLAPGWKDRLFDSGVWLEDLLREAAAVP